MDITVNRLRCSRCKQVIIDLENIILRAVCVDGKIATQIYNNVNKLQNKLDRYESSRSKMNAQYRTFSAFVTFNLLNNFGIYIYWLKLNHISVIIT